MERRQRALPIFLIAGFVAVLVTALPLFSSSSASPATMVQYTQMTKVNLPGMGVLKMFMKGANTETRVTTTIGPGRTRTDNNDGTSYIIQCDLKQVVHLDTKAKTYWVKTFAEAQAYMDAQYNAMAQKLKTATMPPPQPQGSPIQGKGTVTVDFNEQPDDQTQVIAGMTAHHVVDTVTLKFAGTGDCKGSGDMSFRSDEWYVKNELPSMSCPNAPRMRMPQTSLAPAGPQQASPCFSFQSAAHSKSHPGNRFVLKEDTSMGVGGHFGFSTHDEITSYQTLLYDRAFLDVPAGYTQVQPTQAP